MDQLGKKRWLRQRGRIIEIPRLFFHLGIRFAMFPYISRVALYIPCGPFIILLAYNIEKNHDAASMEKTTALKDGVLVDFLKNVLARLFKEVHKRDYSKESHINQFSIRVEKQIERLARLKTYYDNEEIILP